MALGTALSGSRLGALFACELLQILRDRRALFFAVVLPALLYPLIFLFNEKVEDVARHSLSQREVRIAADLAALPETLASELEQRLLADGHTQLVHVDASALLELSAESGFEARRELALRLRGEEALVLLLADPRAGSAARMAFQLWSDVKDDVSREGRQRVSTALEAWERELEPARRATLLGADPAAGLGLETVDVASPADKGAHSIARLLPPLAMLLLLTGASYAALAVFAGEREAGTLETLLVQPVTMRAVALAKLATVLLVGLAALVLNLASLFACFSFGLGQLGQLGSTVGLSAGRMLSTLVWLPGALCLCGLLCVVLARAKSFREGQLLLLPLLLVTALPAAIVANPDVGTDPVLAALPLLGSALCLRDALLGTLELSSTVVMVLAHLAYTAAAAYLLVRILEAEGSWLSAPISRAERERALGSQALRWCFLVTLALLVVGSRLQAWRLEAGLVLTFVALLPVCTWLAGRGARRLSGARWSEVLYLRLPQPLHLLGALLLVPSLAHLLRAYAEVQGEFLPLPRSLQESDVLTQFLGALPRWKVVLYLGLFPGLFEELCFRGPLLYGLAAGGKRARAVLVQALFFGAAHAALWRLVPTAFLGALFSLLVLRTRSLWTAVLVHGLYDLLTVAWGLGWVDLAEGPLASWSRWSALPGLVLLLAVRAPQRARGAAFAPSSGGTS